MTKLEFKAEVKKQLALRCWGYETLAKRTGYTHGSIQTMMCSDEKLSPQAIKNIAEVLGISLEELPK